MGTTNILDLNNRLEKVEKKNVEQNSYTSLKNKPKINGVTLIGNKSLADIGAAAADDLTSMDHVISFPFTMPSDVSSTAIGENIVITLSANIPDTAYIIGVSVTVFTQKRTLIGEYCGQVGFKKNQLYLINVLKNIPSAYEGISGHLIVGIPHS